MKTKLYSLIICFLMAGYSIQAQYAVVSFNEAYSEIENPISLGVGDGWDDPEFTLPLGFEFGIDDLTVDELVQNGLGAGFIAGTFDNGAYLGYFNDVIDGGIASPNASTITYSTEGEAGNRICKIQYKDCAFYAEVEGGSTAVNRVNFQIWFYETDFAVEFRFGTNSVVNPAVYEVGGAQIGIATGISNDGETVSGAVILTGDPANPTALYETNPNILEGTALSGTPEDGQVYRFVPSALSTENETASSFSVYPSPAINEIRISGDIEIGENYRISDISGKVVLDGVYMTDQPISVSSLTPGLYLLSTPSSERAVKFTVQN